MPNQLVISEVIGFSHEDDSSALSQDKELGSQVSGSHRFTKEKNKSRVDKARSIKGKLNAKKGVANRRIGHRKWAKTLRARTLLKDLGKHNAKKTESAIGAYYWRRIGNNDEFLSESSLRDVSEWLSNGAVSGFCIEYPSSVTIVGTATSSHPEFGKPVNLINSSIPLRESQFIQMVIRETAGSLRLSDSVWTDGDSYQIALPGAGRLVEVKALGFSPPKSSPGVVYELGIPPHKILPTSQFSFSGVYLAGSSGVPVRVYEDSENNALYMYETPIGVGGKISYGLLTHSDTPLDCVESAEMCAGAYFLTLTEETDDTEPQGEQETVDMRLDRVIALLVSMELLDTLQDVNFDDNGSLYLFINPVVTDDTIDAIQAAIDVEYGGTGLLSTPNKALPDEEVSADWWVMFVPAFPDAPLGELVDEISSGELVNDPVMGKVIHAILQNVDVDAARKTVSQASDQRMKAE